MKGKIDKILILASMFFLGSLANTAQAAQLNMDEFKEEIANINEYADYVYIIGKYAFTSASGELSIQDVMLAARSIQLNTEDGEIKGKTAFDKMAIHELEPILDENDKTIGWKIADNMVGNTKLLLDDDNKIDIEYIDYNKVINKYHVTFKAGYENGEQKTIRVEENKNIPEDQIPEFSRGEEYKFKGWFKEDGTEFKPSETTITGDITLEAKWYNVVDISKLLEQAAEKIKSEDYGAEFKNDALIFNVYNKAKKNSQIQGTGLIGDIVGILANPYITKLKITCTEVLPDLESQNYVEFTKDMVSSGSGPQSDTWLKFQELLKKATGKVDFNEITLGDLIKCGNMKLEVTMDPQNAVAKDEKTQFDIKLIEVVQKDKLAEQIKALVSAGSGYEASYEDETMTIHMKDAKKELSSVRGSNILAVLYSMLKDNVSSIDLSTKEGKFILTAEQEQLDTYNREWLVEKLKENQIVKNRDLVDKEFILTLHLGEKAQTNEETKDITYNIVFKATTYTVTFENNGTQTQQTVVQGDKVSKPEIDPSKDGYEFQYWAKEGEDNGYNFEDSIETDLKLRAVFKKPILIDSLIEDAISEINSEDFKVNFKNGAITIDIINNDKQISQISGTNIIVKLKEIIETEGVESVNVEYQGTSVKFLSTEKLDYGEIAERLKTVIAQMTGGIDKLSSLVDKKVTVTITADKYEYILKSENDISEDDKVKYDINFISNYIEVINEQSLKDAIKGTKEHIIIAQSFDVSEDIEISRNVTIENKGTNTITRSNGKGTENYIFKISGNNEVTLNDLKLTGASSAILVGDNATVVASKLDVSGNTASGVKVSAQGTFTGIDLTCSDENYKKPAIAVLTSGIVTNADVYTRLDNPYEITRKDNEDILNKKQGVVYYYINSEHSNLYQITFRLKGTALSRFCMQGEKPTAPNCVNQPYDDVITALCRYTFNNVWNVDNEAPIVNSSFPGATKNVTYYAQYTQTPFEKVNSKAALETAISHLGQNGAMPIVIGSDNEEELQIDINNLQINTNQPVTLIGKGKVTLKGTITATSSVPSLNLHKLNIVGDGTGNEKSNDISNRYYIVKSEAKNFRMWNTTISNKAQDGKIAYRGIIT